MCTVYHNVTMCYCVTVKYHLPMKFQGFYWLSGKASYRKISWSLEAARIGYRIFQSIWNLIGISAVLPGCLSNSRAIQWLQHRISRLRDLTKSYGKTSHRVDMNPPWNLATKNHSYDIHKTIQSCEKLIWHTLHGCAVYCKDILWCFCIER